MIDRRLNRHSEGFTVLEMAISLAIAGVALVVLLQLLSTSLITAGRADQISEATMLARSKLLEATAVEPVRPGSETGSGPHQLRWRVEVSAADQGAPDAGVQRGLMAVTVSIFALRRGEEVQVLQLNSLAFAAAE